MKLPEIKKPNIDLSKLKEIDLPDFKKPDIKLPKPKFDLRLSEGIMLKLWTAGSVICLGCSGIALIVAMF